jgi:hypothetical protein
VPPALKMEAIRSSETSGTTLRTTRRHIPEDDTLRKKGGSINSFASRKKVQRLIGGLKDRLIICNKLKHYSPSDCCYVDYFKIANTMYNSKQNYIKIFLDYTLFSVTYSVPPSITLSVGVSTIYAFRSL